MTTGLTATRSVATLNAMSYFLAVDVETTGLEFGKDYIIEFAAILLDDDLQELERFSMVRDDLPCATVQLDVESDFVQQMHTRSGLFDSIAAAYRPGNKGWTKRVDVRVLDMLKRHPLKKKETIHLLGDSVHFDRNFIRAAGMTFESKLHHRHADCSALRLCHPWMPKNQGQVQHRAISDVEFSIHTWSAYRQVIQACTE